MSENHFFNIFLLLLVVSIKFGRDLNFFEMLCFALVYAVFVWLNKEFSEKRKIEEEIGDKQ